MNRLIIFVLTCLFTFSEMLAQTSLNQPKYFPQGTTWVRSTENFGSQKLYGVVSSHTVNGSTVINGKEYYMVESTYYLGEPKDSILIRETDDKVYIYSCMQKKEILYYDFDWEDDHQVALIDYYSDTYLKFSADESTGVKLADGQTYESMPSFGLVRTIGYVEGMGLFSLFYDVPDNGARMFISSFIRNGVEIIHRPIIPTSLSPLPCVNGRSAQSDASNSKKSVNDKCFDLFGRSLAAPPAKGVYIQDGKKVTR